MNLIGLRVFSTRPLWGGLIHGTIKKVEGDTVIVDVDDSCEERHIASTFNVRLSDLLEHMKKEEKKMSLFQCSKCGCVENTAASDGGYLIKYLVTKEQHPEAYASYKKVLGLKDNEPFGQYCCVCNPIWFDKGNYGIGECPTSKQWHDRFDRMFLKKGKWITDRYGNLAHIDSGETDFKKYAKEKEQ